MDSNETADQEFSTGEDVASAEDCRSIPDDLENQREEMLKKISDYEEVIRRQQAEFDNFRKRTEREKIEFSDYASFAILKDLLAVKDSFDMALAQSVAVQQTSVENFLAGFRLVSDQLLGIFQKYEVSEMLGEGSQFDPTLHQALRFQEDDSIDQETVGQVYQKGYLFKKKLLREASVCVHKPVQKIDIESSAP